ncbi:type IV pilus modification PilV family protein [Roseateles flavus]|uniref:Prepilin-type N-terminal cleavage/methylation domain-containing protein n=1 Tax=Roseateles flavus TaxID=3149041 RepID=A0ABV0GA09_9BURK
MTFQQGRRRPRQRGIALIEAMIGVLIFAFGVLGLIGLQAAMTRAQTNTKFRADAANLAADLIALIQTDTIANMKQYEKASCAAYPRCKEWRTKVKSVLPSAEDPEVTVDTGTSKVDIIIRWQQGSDTNQYQTVLMWQP